MFCVCVVDPGAFGTVLSGNILPFNGGDCMPGLGTGGAALGFSKLSPSFLRKGGNRGLIGGLVKVPGYPGLSAPGDGATALVGLSSACALSNL